MTCTVSDQRIIRAHVDHLRRSGALPRTCDYRRGVLTRLAQTLPVDLLDATRDHLLDWRAGLDHLAPDTVGSYVSNVACFYRWAVDEGRLDVDPAARLPRPRPRRHKPRPIPHDDLTVALSCAPEPIRTWILLARLLGLRSMEIAAMRRQDILVIEGRHYLDGVGKGAKAYRLPIPGPLMDALQPHLVGGPGRMWRSGPGGQPARPRDISRQVGRFFDRLGMPYRLHQLRHSYATALYGQTRDPLLVREAMRHSSVNTILIYTETASSATAAAMERQAARFAERRSRRTRAGDARADRRAA